MLNSWDIKVRKLCYEDNLNFFNTILYIDILRLSAKKGYCFVSNKYLSKLENKDVRTIKRSLSILRDKNYIETKIIFYENSNRIKERRIYPLIIPKGRNIGLLGE